MTDPAGSIQVGIALSNNAEGYLRFLLWSMRMTATDPTRIRLLLGVNHGASPALVSHIAEESGFAFEVFRAVPGGAYGSDDHGRALDVIFSRMASGLGMLADVDIAFLEKGWDALLVQQLDDRHPVVGTEYDGPKYLGFPNVICAMFDVDTLRALGMSFIPEGSYVDVDDSNVSVYGGPVGRRVLLDTGSLLPKRVRTAGLDGRTLQIHREGSPGARFMAGSLRGEEYQLDGVPILTHIGRSYTRAFGVDPYALAWEARVREWLAR